MVLHIPVYQIILLNDPEEILNIGIRNTYFLVYDTDRFPYIFFISFFLL